MTCLENSARDQKTISFFFQAEDGIRDATVTGVQTCALPIYADRWQQRRRLGPEVERVVLGEIPLLRRERIGRREREPSPAGSEPFRPAHARHATHAANAARIHDEDVQRREAE